MLYMQIVMCLLLDADVDEGRSEIIVLALSKSGQPDSMSSS